MLPRGTTMLDLGNGKLCSLQRQLGVRNEKTYKEIAWTKSPRHLLIARLWVVSTCEHNLPPGKLA